MNSTYSETKFVKPKHELNAFNCPHCGAYAHQKWSETYSTIDLDGGKHNDLYVIPNLTIGVCEKCEKTYSVWQKGKMFYPLYFNVPFPEETLPQKVKEDFMEARSVCELSPKLACSLLRYTTKKLIEEIIKINNDAFVNILNNDVNTLIRHQLPPDVGASLKKAFKDNNDNYIHEGFIDPTDNDEQALKLFELLNFVSYLMITKQRAVNDFCTKF